MFYLKLFNKTLLKFNIKNTALTGQKVEIFEKCNKTNEKYLPIGLSQNNESIMKWLKGRTIPKNREFVHTFLAKNGLSVNDISGILKTCKGLSLNDSYWIVENENDKFEDYNLYEHNFLTALSLIAYTGFGNSKKKGFSSSPEFTTNGMLKKAWRRDNNGKIYLYKGGTSGAINAGKEPYSEFYASQIAKKMGLKHVDYNLTKWKGSLCSTCELFTNINYSFVPINRCVKECSLKSASKFIKKLGDDFYNDYVDMLIFDSVICNEDRHFGNFGLIVDSKINKIISFAPIFDNGMSLFNFALDNEIEDLNNYTKTRYSSYGIPFDNIIKEFITKHQKSKVKKLFNFKFEKHKYYNLPHKRLKYIENYIREKARKICSE